LQVGNTIIEVLPKADNNPFTDEEKKKWQNILIDMLRAVKAFDIHAPSSSMLKLKPNTILDLYFELFINEVEYLLHNGLVKQYRKKEGNVNALKGTLQFGKHIQQNIAHQERFYVKHTIYDQDHLIHFILYKAIFLLKQINTNSALHSRIGALILNFPEMPEVKITEKTFDKLVFNRKTAIYKKAIEIAKLILLQYHPDLSKGRNDVLALMFDMNKLWEKFVYVSLRKEIDPSITIVDQNSMNFWKSISGSTSRIRPDIVINKNKMDCVVLDTKWKNLYDYNPSPDDLRQIYVYHKYYKAKRVALVYPGLNNKKEDGIYLEEDVNNECSVISLAVEQDIKAWQTNIQKQFRDWLLLPVIGN